jgi:hypothetical protein
MAGTGAHVGEFIRNISRKSWREEAVGRIRHRWEDNIKVYVKYVACDSVDWIHIGQVRGKWRDVVNNTETLGSKWRRSSWVPVSLKKYVSHGVYLDRRCINSRIDHSALTRTWKGLGRSCSSHYVNRIGCVWQVRNMITLNSEWVMSSSYSDDVWSCVICNLHHFAARLPVYLLLSTTIPYDHTHTWPFTTQ